MKRAALLVFALLLAGCASQGADEEVPDAAGGLSAQPDTDVLFGYVLDPAIAPIEGATVDIPGENLTATTDKDGYYGFPEAPVDRVLVVVTTAPGFKPGSKSVTLMPDARTVLNFTLERIPVKTPYNEPQVFNGFIGCSGVIRTEDARYEQDCGSLSPQEQRVWEFNVNEDLQNVVIEVAWDANSDLAEHLNITVETVGFGGFDEILAQNEGESILRAEVTRAQSERFYREGGTIRVTMDIGRNIEDQEVGVGVGWAIQQEFEVIATAFYVAPGPPGYTAA